MNKQKRDGQGTRYELSRFEWRKLAKLAHLGGLAGVLAGYWLVLVWGPNHDKPRQSAKDVSCKLLKAWRLQRIVG